MRDAIAVGWGGSLQFISSHMGPRVVSQDLVNAPVTTTEVTNEYQASLSAGITDNYPDSLWGGPISNFPMNMPHKPGAFYYGDFYYYKFNVDSDDSRLFLLRFDGSGQHYQQGASEYENKSFSGRGTEFISPSGGSDINGGPMCVVPHNGSLFFVGTTRDRNWNLTTSTWRTKADWDTGPNDAFTDASPDTGTARSRRRAYCSYFVTKKNRSGKEHRGFGKLGILYNRTQPSGLTSTYEDLNACDAISWNNSIIYANNMDIVEFPGGSGTPRMIEVGSQATSKSFEPHPTSGFNQTTGAAVGNTELMYLTGSGVLRKVRFPGDSDYNPSGVPFGNDLFGTPQAVASGKPFGTSSIVNLGSLVSDFFGPKVRTSGPMGRIGSTTENPDRTCHLATFKNRLHAFFLSAASGYYHMTCEGNPSDLENWTDRTPNLPLNFRIQDGAAYGYRDDQFNTLNMLHVAYSNIGVFGTNGGNTGAGGWTLYSLDEDLNWTEYYSGASSGPPCGLVPYNPEGLFTQVPSGISPGVSPGNPVAIPSTDYVEIQYQLFSPRGTNRLANVTVEYSTNNGRTWNAAKRFKDYSTGTLLGEGTINLGASPEGTMHTYTWAHVADLGFNFNQGVKIRVTPITVR